MKPYRLNMMFEAPDLVESQRRGNTFTRFFTTQDVVFAEPYRADPTLMIANGRYLIPKEYLDEAPEIRASMYNTFQEGAIGGINDMYDEVKKDSMELKNEMENVITGKLSDKRVYMRQAYKRGAVIGAGAGIIAALYYKKSVLLFAVGGLFIGGWIANKVAETKFINNPDLKTATNDKK